MRKRNLPRDLRAAIRGRRQAFPTAWGSLCQCTMTCVMRVKPDVYSLCADLLAQNAQPFILWPIDSNGSQQLPNHAREALLPGCKPAMSNARSTAVGWNPKTKHAIWTRKLMNLGRESARKVQRPRGRYSRGNIHELGDEMGRAIDVNAGIQLRRKIWRSCPQKSQRLCFAVVLLPVSSGGLD